MTSQKLRILGSAFCVRDLAFGSDPGPWEEGLDPEIDASDPKIEKKLNQKYNKSAHSHNDHADNPDDPGKSSKMIGWSFKYNDAGHVVH